MIDSTNLALFLIAGITLNLTPGPDMLYVAARSMGQGRGAGIASAFGIAAGSLVHMVAATLGLSALLAYSSLAFTIVKYAGAAYLVYLGIRAIRGGAALKPRTELTSDSKARVFWQGAVTNLLNPKVALFFLSFLPQFIDPGNGAVWIQIVILALLFNFTGTTVNVLVAVLTSGIGNWISGRPAVWRFQRWLTGSVLIGLGIKLALPDQR